ncbi:hypothetical protein HY994_05655 [Candidatus Micrarchaeota archaeon]|nr:hypothetical protein [Candidatus Micrarchaeota archaeon]
MDFHPDSFTRPSVIVLLFSNLVPLIGVLFLGWSQGLLLLLYWLESAVIGAFTLLKMRKAQGMPTGSLKVNGQTVEAKTPDQIQAMKKFLMHFFVMHFGIFMFVHLMFLLFFLFQDSSAWNNLGWNLLLGLASTIISHGFSYQWNYLGTREFERTSADALMLAPYPRIFLMQFAVILGFMLNAPAVVLVVGKAVFDLGGHLYEHGNMPIALSVRVGEES